jgi:hypothetical protein
LLLAWSLPCLAAFAASGLTAGITDFSGTWKMDPSRSDFGRFPGPSQMTDQIVQNGAEMVINRSRDGDRVVIHLPLDGSRRENKLRVGTVKTSCHWEAATLIIEYSGLRGGTLTKSEERWTLGPKRNAIKVVRHLYGAKGEAQQTLIMVRVGAPAR